MRHNHEILNDLKKGNPSDVLITEVKATIADYKDTLQNNKYLSEKGTRVCKNMIILFTNELEVALKK